MEWPDEPSEEMKEAVYKAMDHRGIRLSEDDVIDIYSAMRTAWLAKQHQA